MDKKSAVTILSSFRQQLEKKGLRVENLVLFGSCASDTCSDASDIDVVVISKDFECKDYWERIDILSEAIYEVFQPIEAIAMTPGEWESRKLPIANYAKGGELL